MVSTVVVWVVAYGEGVNLVMEVYGTREEAEEHVLTYLSEHASLAPVGDDEWRNEAGLHLRVRKARVDIPASG